MGTKNILFCKKFNNLLWFLSMLCIKCTWAEYNCSEGCVGLELSLENVTEATDSGVDSELSSDDGSNVEVFNITNMEMLRFATPCETPNHEPTLCVEISQCSVLSPVASKKKYSAFVEASKCGPPNENPKKFKVCCGKYNSFRNVSKRIDSMGGWWGKIFGRPAMDKHQQYFGGDGYIPDVTNDTVTKDDNTVFPKKCGTQRHIMRGRIVGGIEATLGEYPWLARIIHKNNFGYKTYGCAGFLIHTKYVVTAAHCIESEFSHVRGDPYSVILGEHNVETKIDCSPGGTFCADAPQISRINKIIVHSKYSNKSKNHHYDIALIQLKKAAKLTEYVQPICLLRNGNEEVKKYYISGWGKTETRDASPIKLKIDITPYDKVQCKKKFEMFDLEIDETQICAGGDKLKDSCNGDSGGPLMMSPNGTQFFAAGLVSYGIGCGLEGWPGVYTSIPVYVDWIETEILKTGISDRSAKVKKHRKKNKSKQEATASVAVESTQSNT